MKILLIDNYDSFTFNLFHYLNKFEVDVTVIRNDKFSIDEVEAYDRIVLSPGPGIPSEAGLMMDVIKKYHHHKKILGICLGMQAFADFFGGSLINLPKVHHGVAIPIHILSPIDPLFLGLPTDFLTGRYHSWSVNKVGLPDCLRITAVDANGEIMGLSHENQFLRGVQFHPESILTEWGSELIENWLYKC